MLRFRAPIGRPLGCTLALLAVTAFMARAGELPEVARGRQIFHTGTSPSGEPITANLGRQHYPLPAKSLPCASCHGPDGRGRPEGGAEPSNITWSALTRPYVVERTGGRRHPPYDRTTLIRAITLGVDPAGNELGIAMPRFHLSKIDAEALASYIEHLGAERTPGVSERRIRIGTLLLAKGPRAAASAAVEAVLRGTFEDLNSQGGIYGRTLELVIGREDLEDAPVFAVVAPLLSAKDPWLRPIEGPSGPPVIGPITQNVPSTADENTFYILSGIEQQARVLWDFAAGRRSSGTLEASIIRIEDGATEDVVQALLDQAKRWHHQAPSVFSYAPGAFDPQATAAAIRQRDAVFFLGAGGDAERLLQALEREGQPPDLLIPGALAGRLIVRPSRHVFLGLPSLPGDATPDTLTMWRAFSERHGLTPDHHISQRLARVAAELLIAALRNIGRELSQDALRASLEGLYAHQTGWTPPLTFGPNRRIGALGSYVVQVDDSAQGFTRVTGWLEPR